MPKSILLFALGVSIVCLSSCRSIEQESIMLQRANDIKHDHQEGLFRARVP